MRAPTIPLSSDAAPEETAVPERPSVWSVALQNFGKGVLWGAVAVSALLAVELNFGIPRILTAAVMGFLGFAIISAGEGLVSLLWKLLTLLLKRLHVERGVRALQAVPPVPIGRILAAFVYIAGDILWPDTFFSHLTLPVVGEMAIALTGFAVMLIALAQMDGRSRPARIALVTISVLTIAVFVVWVANPGFAAYVAAPPETAVSNTSSLTNPGLPGPYAVQTLSYGSGNNARRPQYGEAAALITPSVDGSALFAGYGSPFDQYFRWYWGFDFRQLPLNGMVWYPAGEAAVGNGPFPLVLIVHGNHAMSEYSDPGYAYLAEHLASQGYIAVSVDENFLNGLFFFDGGNQEIPLRAWLLLRHLQQWQTWNETPGPFMGQVDMTRIALIGHSRGGEAVAWAAEMNWKDMADLSTADDFGFGIRGVVSIAPSDAYAGPNGRKPNLDHTNYLLLAGGHDSDTSVLYGQQQYSRLRFDENPGGFKALAYVYQANHGQFNSVWAANDRGLYNSWLLNRAPLLDQAAQEQAAKAIITSFLNAALRDETGYRDLFRNPVTAVNWLPEGIILTQYQTEPFIPVDTNNGSAKVEATEVTGGTAAANGVAVAKVEQLKLRDGEINQGNKALRLVWEAGSQPVYEITLPEGRAGDWALTPANALTFALASVPGEPAVGDVQVELETAVGQTIRLPLSASGPVYPALPAHLVKAKWLAGLNGFPGKMTPEEVVLQTYTMPLAAFQGADPLFQPDQLTCIRFLFDGTAAGAVYLDSVGISQE